jgi:LuxR family maltose regulon positive regulatory protein
LAYTDGPLHRFSILARVRQAMGDWKGARGAVVLAKEAAQQTGIELDIERAAALEALICLRSGELTFAREWAEGYGHMWPQAEHHAYLHEFETLVLIRVLLACDRVDEALALSAQWLPALESAQRQGSVIELCLLQALALRLAKQPERARASLAQALALAEPEGYVRLFVDEGESLRTAIGEFGAALRMQSASGEPRSLLEYTDMLLGAFDEAESQLAGPCTATTAAIPLPQSPYPSPVEMLTERELEVLHLLAAGLSNAAIAEELVVTVGTVKTHLKHIYGKLAVGSRTQAVAQARMLGIL